MHPPRWWDRCLLCSRDGLIFSLSWHLNGVVFMVIDQRREQMMWPQEFPSKNWKEESLSKEWELRSRSCGDRASCVVRKSREREVRKSAECGDRTHSVLGTDVCPCPSAAGKEEASSRCSPHALSPVWLYLISCILS